MSNTEALNSRDLSTVKFGCFVSQKHDRLTAEGKERKMSIDSGYFWFQLF